MFGVTHYFSIALSIKVLTQKILVKLKILLPTVVYQQILKTEVVQIEVKI